MNGNNVPEKTVRGAREPVVALSGSQRSEWQLRNSIWSCRCHVSEVVDQRRRLRRLHPGGDNRSGYQQGVVGHRGGEGYEGGHLLASIFGGPGEKVNLVPQHAFQNRGAGPSNVPDVPREDLEVWHNVETDIRHQLDADSPDVKIDWEAKPIYEGSSQVPSSIALKVRVGDGRSLTYEFPN